MRHMMKGVAAERCIMACCKQFLLFYYILSNFTLSVLTLEDYIKYYESVKAVPSFIESSNKHITAYVHFNSHGREFQLHVATNQHLFTSDFHLRVHEDNGHIHIRKVDTRHIIIGHVRGEKNSLVHGKISESHFEGIIHVPGETYHVEQIAKYFPTIQGDDNVLVYKASDVNLTHPHLCGHGRHSTYLQTLQKSGGYFHKTSRQQQLKKRQGQEDSPLDTCTIHVWADYQFYSNVGNNDEATTLDEMALHITESDKIYRDTTFIDGSRELTGYGVAITAADIIKTNNPSNNPLYGTFTVDELLTAFAAFEFNSVCLGHLFTYRDFLGTVGLAYVADPTGALAGGICQERTQTFGGELNLNTGLTTLINFGRRLPQAVSFLVTAHEIGHNFGSPHDPSGSCSPGGSEGNYIMYPTATDGNLPNNRKFSSCSRDVMGRTIVNNGDCFVIRPFSQVCGNGIVEGTEQCDCGSNDTCKQNDPCCKIGVCEIEDDAECSPHKYACCRENCTIAGVDVVCREGVECLGQSTCNGINGSCPQQARDNSSYCNDGNNVCVDGVCSGSVCLKYNAVPCFCTETDDEEENQLCHVCCQFEPDGTCQSTFDRPNVANATIQSGFPCKDFTGYCNDNGECIFVDTNKPLDDLRDLIPSFTSIVEWLKKNWYWVLAGIVATIIIIILLQITYRRKKTKKKTQTDTGDANEHLRLLENQRRQQEEATRL